MTAVGMSSLEVAKAADILASQYEDRSWLEDASRYLVVPYRSSVLTVSPESVALRHDAVQYPLLVGLSPPIPESLWRMANSAGAECQVGSIYLPASVSAPGLIACQWAHATDESISTGSSSVVVSVAG